MHDMDVFKTIFELICFSFARFWILYIMKKINKEHTYTYAHGLTIYTCHCSKPHERNDFHDRGSSGGSTYRQHGDGQCDAPVKCTPAYIRRGRSQV